MPKESHAAISSYHRLSPSRVARTRRPSTINPVTIHKSIEPAARGGLCCGFVLGSSRVSANGNTISDAAATINMIRHNAAPWRVTSGKGVRPGCANQSAHGWALIATASTAQNAASSSGAINQRWRLMGKLVTCVSYKSNVILRRIRREACFALKGSKHGTQPRIKMRHGSETAAAVSAGFDR